MKGRFVSGAVCLLAFLERMDAAFFNKTRISPHTREHAGRLGDEPMLSVVAENVKKYLKQKGDFKAAAKVALRRVELVYYKPKEACDTMKKAGRAAQTKTAYYGI